MENRNIAKIVVIVMSILCAAIQTWASGIENKVSWSAEFVRTVGNRNAATDSADIAAYNPAGLVKLEDGAYLNVSTQVMYTESENEVNGISFDSETTSLVPGVFSVYKNGAWAGFLTLTIPGGGGNVDFDEGNGTTYEIGRQLMFLANSKLSAESVPRSYFYDGISSQSLEAEHFVVGVTLGGSYQLNDILAIAMGMQYVTANKNAKGKIAIDASNALTGVNGDLQGRIEYEQTAQGYAGVIGICLFPNENLTIGARYETITKLRYDTDVKDDNLGILAASGITNTTKVDRDLPAYIALGTSYSFTSTVRVEASFNYYFNENADWDGLENSADNGFDAGFMLEYSLTTSLKVSAGYLYTNTAIDSEAISREALQLNANSVGGGFQYQFGENLTTNVGFYYSFYHETSRTTDIGGLGLDTYRENYDKALTNVAVGIQYKF